MKREALRGHALVLISTLAGIVGMGIMFGGAMHGNLQTMMQGAPFLLLGLWWAGRELGRSMILSRARSARGENLSHPSEGSHRP
jgi:Na+/proline symporter